MTEGCRRVAAFQTVSTAVRLNLGQEASLCWMASVKKAGELGANQMARDFTSDSDQFGMQITESIRLDHDAKGWAIPSYESNEYFVYVGFGLKIRDWTFWAYSVCCTPLQPMAFSAGSYVLSRWDGHELIGDPVVSGEKQSWSLPLGNDYSLSFDERGEGTLQRAPH